jgi:alpha-pyrone synthase
VTSSNATTRIVGYELGVAPYRVEVATQTTAMVASIENPLKHVVFSPSVANMLTEKLQIATKHCVLYPPLYVQRVPTMSYRERMAIYQRESLKFAVATVSRLFARLEAAGERAPHTRVTHVVTVSCTGAAAPGLHDLVASRFNLPLTCKRFGLNYMGCHGGVKALALAQALARESLGNRVLVVCVELCSLHKFPPRLLSGSEQCKMDIIANLLFADGAAAVLVEHSDASSSAAAAPTLQLIDSWSVAIPDSEPMMTWEMGPTNYEMFISKDIKQSIESRLADALAQVLREPFDKRKYDVVIHPGGPSILRSVQKALALDPDALASSYAVLERMGNMSSPTIFYVLDEYLRTTPRRKPQLLVIAFGPGLTIEVSLLRVAADDAAVGALVPYRDLSWIAANSVFFKASSFSGRSLMRELMDEPLGEFSQYTESEYVSAMLGMNRLHKYLFYNAPFYRAVERFKPRSIVEIGCGGGYLARRVGARLPAAQLTAVDRNPHAIQVCLAQGAPPPNVRFVGTDADVAAPDVVYASDVCHHMDDEELVAFIRAQYERVSRAVIILDLHRHWLASLLFWVPGLLLINWLCRADGFVSIERAFTRDELLRSARDAGVPESCIELRWVWPFRWLLVLSKPAAAADKSKQQ